MNKELVINVLKKIITSGRVFDKSAMDLRHLGFKTKLKRVFNLYNDNKELKMRNIDEVFELVHQYLGVSEVEKKINGEVFTPFELINEMLDTLPNEVWSNPNLKWLDPANGIGNFPAVIIQRLMGGLVDFEPDTSKRYKHILENMIYVCDISSKNMFLYLNIFDPHNEYKMNYFKGSFLSDEFDKHMEEVWGINEFDCGVGNPPYQDGKRKDEANKIYPIVMKKTLDIISQDGYLCMVTPTSWFSSTSDIGKGKTGVSLFKEFKKYNLKYLNPNSDDIKRKFFNGVGSTFCYFLLKKNSNYISTRIGNENININMFDNLPKIQNNLSFSIVEKFNKKSFNLDKFIWVDQNHNLLDEESKVSDNRLKYKNYHTPAKGVTYVYSPNKHPNQEDKKIIISLSGKYSPYLDKGLVGFSNMCLCLLGENGDLGIVYNVVTSKLYRFMVDNNKFSGFNPRKFILSLPKIPLDREWLDEELYEYFNLTEEEINLIEETVKE